MKPVVLSVSAGHHHRECCPVSVSLNLAEEDVGTLSLTDASFGHLVPSQWRCHGKEVTLSWIVRDLRPGLVRTYHLISEGTSLSVEGVQLVQSADQNALDILIDGSLFTSYRFRNVPARPCLYPLIGPYGHPITRKLAQPEDKEMDHHHHRSVWVSHGEVNGVDNWSEAPGHGRTIHRTFSTIESGPVFGRFRAAADWVSHNGQKVLEEVKDITIYNLPSSGRLIDMAVALKATEGDVLFGDTKEGGIVSVRVLPSMEVRHGGRIENSYGGVNEGETWGKRAHWCDYSGPAEGNIVGIAIFDSPGSFRYPTYWHVRDYGLMTANPFGLSYFYNDPNHRGDYTLPAGETLSFSYRLYVHPGDAVQARVVERYHNFINPPVIKVEM